MAGSWNLERWPGVLWVKRRSKVKVLPFFIFCTLLVCCFWLVCLFVAPQRRVCVCGSNQHKHTKHMRVAFALWKKERFECLLERVRVRWERDARWMGHTSVCMCEWDPETRFAANWMLKVSSAWVCVCLYVCMAAVMYLCVWRPELKLPNIINSRPTRPTPTNFHT